MRNYHAIKSIPRSICVCYWCFDSKVDLPPVRDGQCFIKLFKTLKLNLFKTYFIFIKYIIHLTQISHASEIHQPTLITHKGFL